MSNYMSEQNDVTSDPEPFVEAFRPQWTVAILVHS